MRLLTLRVDFRVTPRGLRRLGRWVRSTMSWIPVQHSVRFVMENRTIRHRPFMPTQRDQRGGHLMDRVRQKTELRALQQAKRVTWKRLAATADEYTGWQVFRLWLRAVVEAAGSIPVTVAREVESRATQLLAHIRPDVQAAINGNGPGAGFGRMSACGRR